MMMCFCWEVFSRLLNFNFVDVCVCLCVLSVPVINVYHNVFVVHRNHLTLLWLVILLRREWWRSELVLRAWLVLATVCLNVNCWYFFFVYLFGLLPFLLATHTSTHLRTLSHTYRNSSNTLPSPQIRRQGTLLTICSLPILHVHAM